MGLVSCDDCNWKISTTADICPNCGGKIRRTSILVKIVVGLLVIGFAASFLPRAAKSAEQGRKAKKKAQAPEVVAVYLGEHGDPNEVITLSRKTVVIYQERPCNLQSIPFYQKMRYATMSGVPVCAFRSNASMFIVGAGNPVELPAPHFAQALVDEVGETASVIDRSYNGKAATEEWMRLQREEVGRQLIGAPKPARDNRAP